MKKGFRVILLVLLLAVLSALVVKRMNSEEKQEMTVSPKPDYQASEDADAVAEPIPEKENEADDEADERAKEELRISRRANEILDGMSEHEKVCQLMIVYPDAVSGVAGTTLAGELTLGGLVRYPVGGFVFNAKNLQSKEQVASFISTVQDNSAIDLFMCADEEGGTVTRLMGEKNIDTTWVESMYSYRNQGTETAYSNAYTIASDMTALGFNLELAPVADVWSNLENTVIGERAYSDDFLQATELIPWAVNGFHDGGILCTLKHFPGHGDTASDTHYLSAVVSLTKEELEQRELRPFAAGIEAGADMVMIGHMTVLAYDSCPATLSGNVIKGLLREKMGFDGVVITDGLGMNALSGYYTNAQIAVGTVNAGNDILLGPGDLATAVSAIEAALADGSISEETVDSSVRRILTLKLRAGII